MSSAGKQILCIQSIFILYFIESYKLKKWLNTFLHAYASPWLFPRLSLIMHLPLGVQGLSGQSNGGCRYSITSLPTWELMWAFPPRREWFPWTMCTLSSLRVPESYKWCCRWWDSQSLLGVAWQSGLRWGSGSSESGEGRAGKVLWADMWTWTKYENNSPKLSRECPQGFRTKDDLEGR